MRFFGLILASIIIFSIIGMQESFAEEQNDNLWFVGKDLNFHDYYKYKICAFDDENQCKPFELFLWVKSDLPDKWTFEVMINDDSKKIRGQIDLDKNSQILKSNEEIKTYLNPIRDFFGSRYIAPIEQPQNFNNKNWKNTFLVNQEINLQLSDSHVSDTIGQVYSLQSIDGILFTHEPIQVSEQIPFPIKANYIIFDHDFLRSDNKKSCDSKEILVQKINESDSQCINFPTAYLWSKTKLILTPNVEFELLEFQKHTNTIPSFLVYDSSIDDDQLILKLSNTLQLMPSKQIPDNYHSSFRI